MLVTIYYVVALIKGNNKYNFDTSIQPASVYNKTNTTLHLNTQNNLNGPKSLLVKELFTSLESLSSSDSKYSVNKSFQLLNTKGVLISEHLPNPSSNRSLHSSEMSYFHNVDGLLNNNEVYKKSISLNTLNNLQDKYLLNSLVSSSINDSFSSAEYSR